MEAVNRAKLTARAHPTTSRDVDQWQALLGPVGVTDADELAQRAQQVNDVRSRRICHERVQPQQEHAPSQRIRHHRQHRRPPRHRNHHAKGMLQSPQVMTLDELLAHLGEAASALLHAFEKRFSAGTMARKSCVAPHVLKQTTTTTPLSLASTYDLGCRMGTVPREGRGGGGSRGDF